MCSALPAELERASELLRRQLQRDACQQPDRLSDLGQEGPYDNATCFLKDWFKSVLLCQQGLN